MTSVIRSALPWTLGLVGIATVISFVLGTLLGILVAWRRGTWLDNLLPATTFFQAAPYFFLAFLALDLFAVQARLVPHRPGLQPAATSPAGTPAYIGDVLDHAVLPALTIVVCSRGRLDRRHAERDGHHDGRGLRADRPGQGPGQAAGGLVRGAERDPAQRVRASRWPSASWCPARCSPRSCSATRAWAGSCCQAVSDRDYPLLQGIFLIITFAVLAANLVADFVYVFLDPRTRQEA